MADSSDSFDEFLYRAYESGVSEPEYEADLAEAEAIRPELVTSILAQARRESPRILDDDRPLCDEGIHDFEDYDHPDGSVRRACHDCAEPDDPEIIVPAPGPAELT